MSILSLLEHPLARGLDLDDPSTTALRREIIASKPFLRAVYDDWYRWLLGSVPPPPGRAIELGSGAAFLHRVLPDVIRTDIQLVPDIDIVADGRRLPFVDQTARAILMTNVLHHIPDVAAFLREAARVLREGGALVLIEPWPTAWSRLVYKYLHHEPFDERAANWTLGGDGPLSDANGALPWIVFQRDASMFRREFPELEIESIDLVVPFRYLLSGGMSMRSLMPGWATPLWRAVEAALRPFAGHLAMFAVIVVRRVDPSSRR